MRYFYFAQLEMVRVNILFLHIGSWGSGFMEHHVGTSLSILNMQLRVVLEAKTFVRPSVDSSPCCTSGLDLCSVLMGTAFKAREILVL